MSKKLQRIDLHNRINDLRQTHLNQLRVQAREIFRSMLDGLEDTVNERIYANNGDFPEDLIDMLWIVRSIGNKYGLNRTPDESRRRVFYGVNNGQQGRQFEEWLHQIENLDFETSGTSYEFDPELLKQFYAYVISDRLVGRHRGIEDLCTMPEIVHKPLSEENLDELIIPVLGDDSLIITDFGRLRTCLNVGSRLQSEVYSLIGDIYGDIHSLWGYQGEWIAAEANAIMSGNLQFQDIATLQSSNPELEGSRFFKQFIDELVQSVKLYQAKLQNSGLIFNPEYSGNIWAMVESQNMMAHVKSQPTEYTTVLGKPGNPVYEIVEKTKQKLFRN